MQPGFTCRIDSFQTVNSSVWFYLLMKTCHKLLCKHKLCSSVALGALAVLFPAKEQSKCYTHKLVQALFMQITLSSEKFITFVVFCVLTWQRCPEWLKTCFWKQFQTWNLMKTIRLHWNGRKHKSLKNSDRVWRFVSPGGFVSSSVVVLAYVFIKPVWESAAVHAALYVLGF